MFSADAVLSVDGITYSSLNLRHDVGVERCGLVTAFGGLLTLSRRSHISALPNELLEEIFLIYALISPPLLGSRTYADAGWAVLLCVCREWYLLITRCTEFWATVHHHNPSTMSMSLARSGTRGVEYVLADTSVTGRWPLSVYELRNEVATRALREFKPSRCVRIEVMARGDVHAHLMKILGDSDGGELPLLRVLLLSWGWDIAPNFFGYVRVGIRFVCLRLLLTV